MECSTSQTSDHLTAPLDQSGHATAPVSDPDLVTLSPTDPDAVAPVLIGFSATGFRRDEAELGTVS